MKRRTTGIIVGLLAVICLVLILSVTYPFSTSEPHAVKDEQFSTVEGSEYHVSGAITIDGDDYLVLEEAVVEDGARYLSLTVKNVKSVSYQAGPCEEVYTRSEYPEEDDAEQVLERIEEREDQHILRVDRDGEGVVFFTREENTADCEITVKMTASLVVENLRSTNYERVQKSAEGHIYEPQNGWFDGGYRITGSSGQVRVDPHSYTVTAADVSYTVTPGAETYAEYLHTSWTTDESFTKGISYDYTSNNVSVEMPRWVEELQDAE
ncbi:hypothetical protein [Natronosalvus halobius]|uniref:hypothetical protein n=1 Tax=Natronosalvus halobius TaxID=2953746 RepID=UPI0020A0EA95|nr:hypothetical protein [Natronosalvus halobius]USZ73071.1 hypothetical protein NGM15_07140 [Natronosalvus halobius]